MTTECLIIGGGASGLAAAARLRALGIPFVLAERLDRVGKKLLATGNGRCNCSNRNVTPAAYGKARPFADALFRFVPPRRVSAFLESLGVMLAEEEGRLYPRTMSAASVLDALREPLPGGTGRIETGARIVRLRRGNGLWEAAAEDGRTFSAASVLFACGGSAAPKFGTDGSAFELLAALGHPIVPPRPALVQLRCRHAALPSLKGLRIHAAPTLLVDGQAAAAEEGELLFAEYGVSGICVLQLSGAAADALSAGRTVSLSLDLLPELPAGDTAVWLRARLHTLRGRTLLSLFTGVFPRMLTQAVLRECGLRPDAPADQTGSDALQRLARTLRAFPLPVTGTLGFDHAQVTRGGAALHAVDPATMASRLCPGLYVAGEALDVDGPCGGYNLHFAFASALAAADAIGRRASRKEDGR